MSDLFAKLALGEITLWDSLKISMPDKIVIQTPYDELWNFDEFRNEDGWILFSSSERRYSDENPDPGHELALHGDEVVKIRGKDLYLTSMNTEYKISLFRNGIPHPPQKELQAWAASLIP